MAGMARGSQRLAATDVAISQTPRLPPAMHTALGEAFNLGFEAAGMPRPSGRPPASADQFFGCSFWGSAPGVSVAGVAAGTPAPSAAGAGVAPGSAAPSVAGAGVAAAGAGAVMMRA